MFENVSFNGQFRVYQQKILDNADKYLRDGKIHIVAAPGSGKTVLGLELIVRLGEPCIILSPTTTIRNQWGDRFEGHFLNGKNPQDYVSYDLKSPKPLICVTYQALHAAVKGLKDVDDGVDYCGFDLFAHVREYGVKTICLDEAHHLQNEWQKALEAFLQKLGKSVKVIALTATPPYDANPAEWNRYVATCGEIDEEIFVPELVRENSLCPHQDYVYFNYPTAEETASFNDYKNRSADALNALYSSPLPKTAYDNLLKLKRDYDFLYSDAESLIHLFSLFKSAGIKPDGKLVRTVCVRGKIPPATCERLSAAVNYLCKSELLSQAERDECLKIFKSRGLTERGEICLGLNEKLKKRLISSTGKLKSISEIVKSEAENKRAKLRMLILTDFIKKDEIALIGSDKAPDAVSIVSVFETVRRTGVRVAALSGSLVILPDNCKERLLADGTDFTCSPLGNTGYSEFNFRLGNREKVRLVSDLFEDNAFSVLVGTKSLLGEGWDAPCVNSLILASFIGSFMLSNQMRGRAIRTDGNTPDKTANVWHLVTIEVPRLYEDGINKIFAPKPDKDEINSCDFETVKRRFDCFVAPNYDTGEIESGISRVTLIKPPYDKSGIESINNRTLELAAGNDLNSTWRQAVSKSTRLTEAGSVPKKDRVPPFLFVNLFYATLLLMLSAFCIMLFVECVTRSILADNSARNVVAIAAVIVCVALLIWFSELIVQRILKHISPKKSIHTICECVMSAMQDAELLDKDVKLKVDGDRFGIFVEIELTNASVHDQNLFHTAVGQMLSPIESPRYLLIPKGILGGYRYGSALACPEILGSKKEYAQLLAARLGKSAGKIETVFTRNDKGRKLILKCRNRSYITKNDEVVYQTGKHLSY